MTNRNVIVFACVVGGLTIAGAFYAGRQVERSRFARSVASLPETTQAASRQHLFADSSPDAANALIQNIGDVAFEQAYDLIRSASTPLRAQWARQLEALLPGPRKTAAVAAYYRTLVQVDAKAAATLVVSSHDHWTRMVAADAVLGAAAEPDYESIAETFLNQLSASLQDMEWYDPPNIFWNWSEADPESAARFLAKHSEDYGEHAYRALLDNWAAMDPSAALEWFDAQAPSTHTSEAFRGLLLGWVRTDRAGATDYMVAHAADPKFDGVLTEFSQELFRRSPDDARSLVRRLPNPDLQKKAVSEIVGLASGGWLHTPSWRLREPADAARWLVTLPEELWREEIGGLATVWDNRDDSRRDFSSWIAQLPVETRYAVIAGYCGSAGSDNAPRALALAQSISDPAARESALLKYVRGYQRTRVESLELIKDLPITNAEKARLAKLLPPK